MIVVKVGGSLFDHPQLGPGLRAYLETLAPAEVLLVPGGGAVADAVRAFDRTHALGEEAAHWLALRSLSVTRALLEALCGKPNPPSPFPRKEGGGAFLHELSHGLTSPTSHLTDERHESALNAPPPSFLGKGDGGLGLSVLDPFTFALEDEARPHALPHTWSVTTDSIAARAAVVFGAERLILLKSADVPSSTPWEEAVAFGWVDVHFPQIAATLACPIECVNFRRYLSAHA